MACCAPSSSSTASLQHITLQAARQRPIAIGSQRACRSRPPVAAAAAAASRLARRAAAASGDAAVQQQQAPAQQPAHESAALRQPAEGLTLEGLTLEEVQHTLACRGLDTQGVEAELRQRLAAYLAALPPLQPTDTVELLGGRLFAGQQQLRAHIQLLLELLVEQEVWPEHADFAFLDALLRRHPRYSQKVRPPVAAFRVREEKEEDLAVIRCFEFMDASGAWDDFSYRKCIRLPSYHNAELTFRDAMRHAVRDQLTAFKLASSARGTKGQPVFVCDVCGKRMREEQSRVSHVEPTFGQLIADFAAAAGRPPPPVDGRVPGVLRGCFSDQQWVADWRRYHRRNAHRMELACQRCAKKSRDAQRQAASEAQRQAAGGGGGEGSRSD